MPERKTDATFSRHALGVAFRLGETVMHRRDDDILRRGIEIRVHRQGHDLPCHAFADRQSVTGNGKPRIGGLLVERLG